MGTTRAAVHRTILVVDVEGFGDLQRTNPDKVAIRQGLYRALQAAFAATGVPWADCEHPDLGDAVFVLAPAEIPKAPFVEALPATLAQALHEHNATHATRERIRLRMVVHAGLGHSHVALGQREQARTVWREALELYRQQGREEDAARVEQQLDDLDDHADANDR